jgi:hypothetical protein
MAHFAKLGVGNIVERVEVVSNDIATNEQAGVDFLNNLYNTNDVWKQTSYNTMGGKYYTTNENQERVESSDQSKSFKKIMLELVILLMKVEMLLLHQNLMTVGH